MFYVLKTGCQWENLPSDFPNYQSVYYHYNKWCKDGTWDRIATKSVKKKVVLSADGSTIIFGGYDQLAVWGVVEE